MNSLNLDEIIAILQEIYEAKQAPLNKSDIDGNELLPSYNTCMRRGIRLHKLNQQFTKDSYYNSPKICPCCSISIPYDKRENTFCGSSCAATYNCTGRVKIRKDDDFDLLKARARKYKFIDTPIGQKPNVLQITNCVNCNIEMAETYNTDRKYCSALCHKASSFEDRFRDWYEFGKNFQNKSIREFLKVLSGYDCAHCGISEWNGSAITLEVEHIDGNSEDSSPGNVCLLCPNCHSQTPTYKGRNKGNGRHKRRLRYQEGKSY